MKTIKEMICLIVTLLLSAIGGMSYNIMLVCNWDMITARIQSIASLVANNIPSQIFVELLLGQLVTIGGCMIVTGIICKVCIQIGNIINGNSEWYTPVMDKYIAKKSQ